MRDCSQENSICTKITNPDLAYIIVPYPSNGQVYFHGHEKRCGHAVTDIFMDLWNLSLQHWILMELLIVHSNKIVDTFSKTTHSKLAEILNCQETWPQKDLGFCSCLFQSYLFCGVTLLTNLFLFLQFRNLITKFLLAQMRVVAHRSVNSWPSAQPPSALAKKIQRTCPSWAGGGEPPNLIFCG